MKIHSNLHTPQNQNLKYQELKKRVRGVRKQIPSPHAPLPNGSTTTKFARVQMLRGHYSQGVFISQETSTNKGGGESGESPPPPPPQIPHPTSPHLLPRTRG